MPIVHIYITPPGPSDDMKQRLYRAVTDAIEQTLGKAPASTRILLHELEGSDWSVAGKPVGNGSGK